MSNRTLIELNHDFAQKIKENPDDFINQLLDLLNNGHNSNDTSSLENYGIKVIPTMHHTDFRVVKTSWEDYEL